MQSAAQEAARRPAETLHRYYAKLLEQLGPQRWWPARTRLEVILGAILTQNTNWRNADLALKRLRKAGLLSWSRLRMVPQSQLGFCVHPAGFFRQKARTIRTFVEWLDRTYGGSLKAMFARPPTQLRQELLALPGIGPETADAILLYAGKRPYFVADAYARRILARHGFVPSTASYTSVQEFLHQFLPADSALFNEFHALLVEVGKRYCHGKVPHCKGCPLEEFLPRPQVAKTSSAQAREGRALPRPAGRTQVEPVGQYQTV